VASLASSPLPTEHVERIGAGLAHGGWMWLKNINSSEEQPGSGDLLAQNGAAMLQRTTPADRVHPGPRVFEQTAAEAQQQIQGEVPHPDIVVGSATAKLNPDGTQATIVTSDQNSADNLLLLLGAAGCNYFMGVPCSDDVMLNYQSTSFHDALYVRDLFGLKRAPEFDDWLVRVGLAGTDFRLAGNAGQLPDFAAKLIA
jgi:hypothetical protein